jgi:hypothetical protein
VKRTRGYEPVGVVISICLETSQGNFLCSYPYLKLAKSCFSFYLFFFYKIREKEVLQERGGWHQWEGGDGRERG